MLNAPGAGYAEAPALSAFLPAVARALTGEALTMPTVTSYWLGHEEARREVLANPDKFVLHDALDGNTHGKSLRLLEPKARAALLGQIEAHGERYAAYMDLRPSAAPCAGEGDTLEARGVILRLFLVWDGNGWRPLPGGLARVLGADDTPGGALPREALSKDVWVLRDEGDIVGGGGNLSTHALPIRRVAGDLPSRVADNFYWFGRYLERLDNAARLSRALLSRLARGAPLPHELPEISTLTACLGEAGLINAEHASAASQSTLADLLQAALTRDASPLPRQLFTFRI